MEMEITKWLGRHPNASVERASRVAANEVLVFYNEFCPTSALYQTLPQSTPAIPPAEGGPPSPFPPMPPTSPRLLDNDAEEPPVPDPVYGTMMRAVEVDDDNR